jgi:exodeoxyribonuclease VII large subunit
MWQFAHRRMLDAQAALRLDRETLQANAMQAVDQARRQLWQRGQLLTAYDPQAVLARGYALVRTDGAFVRSGVTMQPGQEIAVQLADAELTATVKHVTIKQKR